MKVWAIKCPSGNYDTYRSQDKDTAIGLFCKFKESDWLALTKYGYSCVEIVVEEVK